jgi:hypothetical protein
MSIDKVQLQQQEVVNNEVVNTDINPITSTDSVFDINTGSTMQETLDRIWNAINSKLSRIVNSVNNRTGPVVLDSGDVGLGNVDNVSFNDIKEWVIEYFRSMMSNYKFRLFDTWQEMEDLKQTNDKSLDNVPFYISQKSDDEFLSYIGYFHYDDLSETLSYYFRPIKVVGLVDDSLLYNEDWGENKNYSDGRLGVNIHPDEKALKVVHGSDKGHSGLMIDKSVLAHKMVVSNCMYADVDGHDGMLSANASTDDLPVTIYIDNVLIEGSHHLHKGWNEELVKYGLVKTDFAPYYANSTASGKTTPVPKGTSTFNLMNRQPAIGVVTQVIDDDHDAYEVRFYTIKTFTSGFGVKYYANHQNLTPDTQLGIQLTNQEKMGNVSGIQAAGNGLRIDDPGGSKSIPYYPYIVTLPCGWINSKNGTVDEYGSIITTDDSICRYPVHMGVPAAANANAESETTYDGKYLGSKMSDNWAPIAYWGYEIDAGTTVSEPWHGEIKPDGNYNNLPSNTSYLSVNMNKLVRDTGFTLLTEQPDDWDSNWRAYFTREQVSEAMNDYVYAPNSKKYGSKPTWVENKFYKEGAVVTVDGDVYRTDMPRYHFTNISGLKNTHLDPNRFTYEWNDHDLTKDEKEAIGIFDNKDSLGNDISFYPFSNFSGGLAVNVGNFLEICPKETSGGGDYDDSGRVNVRIGSGLADDYSYEEIDTSVIISPPDDYYKHPERFRLLKANGDLVPLENGFVLLTGTEQNNYGKPVDWDTNWRSYYQSYNDMFVPTTAFHHSECPYQPDVFYRYGIPNWDDILYYIETHTYEAIVRIFRTNRIKVNIDGKTLQLGNNDKIVSKLIPEEYDFVNGHYRRNQIIKSHMSGADVFLYATRDFDSNSIPDVTHFTNGDLRLVSYIPDNETITVSGNMFLSSKPVASVYKAGTDFIEREMFTYPTGNDSFDGMYMATKAFKATGDLQADITANNILVIKAAST